MDPVDPYGVLQVLPDAEQEVIHAAFRALALKYHPDRDASPAAQRRMLAVNAAYSLVRDAVARAAWDRARRIATGREGVADRIGSAAAAFECGGDTGDLRPIRRMDAARPRAARSRLPPLAEPPLVGHRVPHGDLPDPRPHRARCLKTASQARAPAGPPRNSGTLGRMPSASPAAQLRAVFLDIGDTVIRPSPSWEHIYAMALAEFGVDVDIEELNRALRAAYHHGGWGTTGGFEPTEDTSFRRTVEIDQRAIGGLGLGPMPEAFFRRLSGLFLETDNWHVFPEVLATLDALHERGLVVGAVSNWVWSLPELLHSLGLVDHFDFIAASARIGFEKPHPEIFRYALDRAEAAPGEVIHVGDHIDADVDGARAVGIGAVLIDRHHRYQASELPSDVPIITALDELLGVVDARGVTVANRRAPAV